MKFWEWYALQLGSFYYIFHSGPSDIDVTVVVLVDI